MAQKKKKGTKVDRHRKPVSKTGLTNLRVVETGRQNRNKRKQYARRGPNVAGDR